VSDWTWEYVADTATVVGGLTSEQIAEAEDLARAWPVKAAPEAASAKARILRLTWCGAFR